VTGEVSTTDRRDLSSNQPEPEAERRSFNIDQQQPAKQTLEASGSMSSRDGIARVPRMDCQ
jgi:hypothetical protein